ncbi:dolichyl-phosphate-mannose-protein mannosyltransferase [Ruminiclostridium sufflavum DSM 19573]|uniref:Dolichyl-phosphate-mannose-protein mannosyltransferase n=1 Tax=Ruminiclostridium sufflavum DSM 19573 TaxID=1121337 RepID=A0A318XMS8_9FIRM|nr:glycosyltransferase family 39 protein [Ruminiclostridium sufflavum]PYG86949.1 dolichyl-phosphate-mannose-protein mannosyltransferase [Ruminiclostridium sufflavum DSM 19573]
MARYFRPNTETKTGAFIVKALISVLALYSLYLILLNFICAVSCKAVSYAGYAALALILFAFACFIAYKAEVSPAAFVLAVFVLGFLTKSIPAFLTDIKPVSDFDVFYQYALKLLNGGRSLEDMEYFRTWAYQTGPVIYYAALMKLFGTGLLTLKLANCFFMAGTNVFIYLIARKISNDYTARAVSLLYLLYPAPYFLAPVLTNQHFAACMFLSSIYVLLIERLNWAVKGILAGAVIAVGNTVRPIGIVIIAASIIWEIIEIIRSGKLLKTGSVIMLLLSYLLVSYGCSAAVKHADINSEGLANNFPLWKFVVGLNYEAKGQFSYEDEYEIYRIQDFNKRNKAAEQVIKQRLSVGIKKLAGLMNAKQIAMWAGSDTLSWGFYQQIDGQLVPSEEVKKIEPIILKSEKMYYIFIFILMLAGFCRSAWENKINHGVALLSLILLCYFGIHFFIEIQVRYRYFAMTIVFILAAKGCEAVFYSLREYRERYP